MSEMLEITQKVFDNRDCKEDILARKMSQATVMAQQVSSSFKSAYWPYEEKRRENPSKRSVWLLQITGTLEEQMIPKEVDKTSPLKANPSPK